jgi:hypothetical protein
MLYGIRNLPTATHQESWLGQRLLQEGTITQEQLSEALREQQNNHLRLGEVCLDKGWVTPEQLYQMIPSQNLALGEILVVLNYIRLDQLRVALAQQKRLGRKLGEILVWKEWITQEELETILHIQQLLREEASPNAWEILSTLEAKQTPPSQPIDLFEMQESDSLDLEGLSDLKPEASLDSDKDRVTILENLLNSREEQWNAFMLEISQQMQVYQSQHAERVKQLEETIDAQKVDLENQQEEFQQAKAQLLKIQSQLGEREKIYQKEIEQYEQVLQQFEEENTSLKIQLKSHQEELEAIQARIEDQAVHLEQSRQRILNLEGELQEAHQYQESVSQKLRTTQDLLLDTESQLRTSKMEMSQKIQVYQSQHLKKVTELEEIIEQQRQKLQSQEAEVETLNQRLLSAQQQIQNLQDAPERQYEQRCRDLEEEKKALQQTITALSQKTHPKDPDLTFETAPSSGVNRDPILDTSISACKDPQKELDTLREDVVRLETELERSQQEQDALKKTLEEVKSGVDLAVEEKQTSPILWKARKPSSLPLTQWAENLFKGLQDAGLIQEADIEMVLQVWKEKGGKLTDVLASQTQLDPMTIKFFADGGYAAKVSGCEKISDFLLVAALISEEDLNKARQMQLPGQEIEEVLVDLDIIQSVTASYFQKTFLTKPV